MTPEQKAANWQKAHDLHYLRHRSGVSLDELGAALGIDGRTLRKMERNKVIIDNTFMGRAEQAVRLLLANAFAEYTD